MKSYQLCIFAAALGAAASAPAAIVIETVLVGDAGNANDASGFGRVDYNYHIGTYEVTNAQYAAFLNAVARTSDPYGLWDSDMGSQARGGITRTGSAGNFVYTTRENKANNPVNYVSFWDAARFANWLTSGDTETGVYTLGGVTNPFNNSEITRNATAWANGGVAIASENEWYKAAYFDPTLNAGSGGYWLYPTQSNTAPLATTPNSTNANSANYDNAVGTLTDVGSYTIAGSYYGTFDQGGNVREWNDEIFFGSFRGQRDGAINSGEVALQSSFQSGGDPAGAGSLLGFRVTSLEPIPEPSAYAAVLGGLGLALALVRRRRRRPGSSA